MNRIVSESFGNQVYSYENNLKCLWIMCNIDLKLQDEKLYLTVLGKVLKVQGKFPGHQWLDWTEISAYWECCLLCAAGRHCKAYSSEAYLRLNVTAINKGILVHFLKAVGF